MTRLDQRLSHIILPPERILQTRPQAVQYSLKAIVTVAQYYIHVSSEEYGATTVRTCRVTSFAAREALHGWIAGDGGVSVAECEDCARTCKMCDIGGWGR